MDYDEHLSKGVYLAQKEVKGEIMTYLCSISNLSIIFMLDFGR